MEFKRPSDQAPEGLLVWEFPLTAYACLSPLTLSGPLHWPGCRTRRGQNQQWLDQALGPDHRLNLDEVLGDAGAGVEGGDVHQHRRERPVGGLGPATFSRVERGSWHQRDTGVTEQPERKAVQRFQQALIEREALPMQGDQPQGRPLALSARVYHEPIVERGFLARGTAQRGPELLLTEGDRMIRYHMLSEVMAGRSAL